MKGNLKTGAKAMYKTAFQLAKIAEEASGTAVRKAYGSKRSEDWEVASDFSRLASEAYVVASDMAKKAGLPFSAIDCGLKAADLAGSAVHAKQLSGTK